MVETWTIPKPKTSAAILVFLPDIAYILTAENTRMSMNMYVAH